jgi:hypothetical protein
LHHDASFGITTQFDKLAACGKTLPAALHLVTPAKAGVHVGARYGIERYMLCRWMHGFPLSRE